MDEHAPIPGETVPPTDAAAREGEDGIFELPPFEPPPDFTFEPELIGPVPRPVPDHVQDGLWARGQRFSFHMLFASAVLCTILHLIPAVRAADLYFLPLAYLLWIAGGLALIAVGQWLWGQFGPSPLRYIQHGVPLVGRVLDLVKQPTLVVNGQPSRYSFVAQVDFLHPESGEHLVMEAKSEDFSAAQRQRYDTSFRVGDYITLVHLPEQLLTSIRPYGFLGLSPDVGLRKVGKPASFWQILAAGAFLVGFIGLLLWNLYAFQAYNPLEYELSDMTVPIIAGALLLGGLLLAFFFYEYRKEQHEQTARNLTAFQEGGALEFTSASLFAQTGVWNRFLQVIVVLGVLLLGGLSGVCTAISANALLDDGPAETVAIQIDEFYEETQSFVFRQYYAEYRLAADPPNETRKFYTTPRHLASLAGQGPFVARIKPGRFGWPWIETLEPAAAPTHP